MGMSGAGLCHVEREGLRFLVPVAQEGEFILILMRQMFHT